MDAIAKLRILYRMASTVYGEWLRNVWREDLDAKWCCGGSDCACEGVTIREVWLEDAIEIIPPKGEEG